MAEKCKGMKYFRASDDKAPSFRRGSNEVEQPKRHKKRKGKKGNKGNMSKMAMEDME